MIKSKTRNLKSPRITKKELQLRFSQMMFALTLAAMVSGALLIGMRAAEYYHDVASAKAAKEDQQGGAVKASPLILELDPALNIPVVRSQDRQQPVSRGSFQRPAPILVSEHSALNRVHILPKLELPGAPESLTKPYVRPEPTPAPKARRIIRVEATAYTPHDEGCTGITAKGTTARPGYSVAVDPDVIPLGSKLRVPGFGVVRAEDTGGAIQGHKIDICVSTKSDAYSFGRRSLEIEILD